MAVERGDDPHDLGRFVDAQAGDSERALAEIEGGRKRSHRMWYIFPRSRHRIQLDVPTVFDPVRRRGRAHLDHPLLGRGLVECAEAAMGVEGRSANVIFGPPDDMKLKSCRRPCSPA